MGKGLPRSRRHPSPFAPAIRLDQSFEVTLDNLDGATGVAWETAPIGDFPAGNILILGAVLNATMTKDTANIIDAFNGDFSVGTTATTDTTLDGTDVDVIPSTATGTASGGSRVIRGASTASVGGTVFDNTDGSLELNLNVLIDDASIDADDQSVTVAGTLHLVYAILGDD